jgi:hypothetical protein
MEEQGKCSTLLLKLAAILKKGAQRKAERTLRASIKK